MWRILFFSLCLQAATCSYAQELPPNVGFSIILTAGLQVREGMLYAGGKFGTLATTNFSAVLVRHGNQSLLFDTGLGNDIARQYRQDMPYWQRPFFKYAEPVSSARAQLDRAGYPPVSMIILSHAHWDHASGVADFPGAEVWVAQPERAFIANAGSGVGVAWASQTAHVDWRNIVFSPVPFEGYDASADVFGDGTVVLVPMYGHTPGSVGMFLTVDSGQRYFFSGDVSWRRAAIEQGRPKFWAARLLVDHDATQTALSVAKVRALMLAHPGLIVIPAHDAAAQAPFGYFPKWNR